jgi:hypothetical protein
MKTPYVFAFAGLVAVGSSLSANADDQVRLSPRAEAYRTRMVSGSGAGEDTLAAIRDSRFSPRALASQTHVSTGATQADPDLLAGIRNATLSPRAQQQFGSSAGIFQVAPAVTKGKACEAGCKDACCTSK